MCEFYVSCAEYSDWFKVWLSSPALWAGTSGVTGALCFSECGGVLRVVRLVHGYEYTTLPEDWLSIVRAEVLVVTPPGHQCLHGWWLGRVRECRQQDGGHGTTFAHQSTVGPRPGDQIITHYHQSPHSNIIKEFMASYKHYLTFSDLDQVPAELNVKTWLSDSDRQYVHSDKRVL